MRHSRRRLLPAALFLLALLVGPRPADAEKPLSPPGVLARTATHVVRGTVERVFARVRRQGGHEVTRYVAEVQVAAVEKGEGIALDRPLYVRYWTQDWKGSGEPPPGTTGHAPLAQEGQAVRLYLARNANDGFGTQTYDGGYDVVGKNGIQPLTPEELRAAEAEAAPPRAPAFPEAWAGVWTGPLTIASPGKAVETATMMLAIQATDAPDRWTFRIRYGDQPQRRYELVVKDAAAGRFEIDEGNSIVLPATYVDGELFSLFSLGEDLITARYRLHGDAIRFDLTQTRTEPVATTGGQGVPEVGAHEVQVVQRARLRR